MNLFKTIILSLIVLVATQGCGVYKFSGASLHPDDKTLSVKYFQNRASLVNPELSQNFTEALKDKFVSQVGLELVNFDADLLFEGEIIAYNTKPVSIVSDESNLTAKEIRLTITVRVKYTSINNEKFNFDSNFTKYADYASDQILSDVEDELVNQIVDELTDEIFNKAVVNW